MKHYKESQAQFIALAVIVALTFIAANVIYKSYIIGL